MNFPPGEFLRDEMTARQWSASDVAQRSGLSEAVVRDVLNARLAVDNAIADGLARAIGTSPRMWSRLQDAWNKSPTREAREP